MKIAVDLGHGIGQDRGAEGYITEESVINAVGILVITKLRALGHEVIEVRPTDVTSVSDSLIKRVSTANTNNVDLYVSLHANAGGGQGTEVYTYRGTKEFVEAINALNNLVALGFVNRGIKGSNLYVINHTNARAMLIEICFVDTKSDVEKYNSIGPNTIADSIVKGLTGETIDTVATVETTPTRPTTVSVVDSWVSALQNECNRQGFSNQIVDGLSGPNTLNGCPLLKIGAKGNITKLLQDRLNDLGFNCGVADGIFGTKTYNAVLSLQRHFGLLADGVVGRNTWTKLLGL